jgi:hypothetical protein
VPVTDLLAAAARTAVAATHGGLLMLPGRPAVEVGYVDDGGEPLVLVSRCETPPTGHACLAVPGAGQRVVLSGRLLLLPGEPDLGRLLGVHQPCFLDALRAGPARLLRLAVESVQVERGGARHDVPWLRYAAAEPDLFVAFGATVASHLSLDHAPLLATVAQHRLPGEQVVAAAVAVIRRGRFELDVVTPDGATRIAVALPADLDDPHELCGRLPDLLVPGGR